jgi:hypothetical protein
MSTNTTPNTRRIGQRGNAEHKSDIEIWANYLVVATLETDAKTMIAEHVPALWKTAMETKDERLSMVLILEALLATPDAATTMVRQIRDTLVLELKDQYREQLDAQAREVIRLLHE